MIMLMRFTGGLLGAVGAFRLAVILPWFPQPLTRIALGLLGALLGWLVTPWLWRLFVRAMTWVLQGLAHLSLRELALGAAGLIVGLLTAFLVGFLVSDIPYVGLYLRWGVALVFGYLGIHLALQRREEVRALLDRMDEGKSHGPPPRRVVPKVMDTSVIIDGRIADVCKTGFLEGPLLVPRFVLAELQRIADSTDTMRRARGRRGLDILNRLQKEWDAVEVIDSPPGIEGDVDARLVGVARAVGGWILTNDFNLNKVAELQGVRVLNVNELAQAMRPIHLPGEELTVHIMKDGKEAGQGIGYLEDGTMVVVEGGKKHIGETSDVVVTSVLQTVAGRMIFARPKGDVAAGSSTAHRR
ncbi:MAG: TRAM domain-containing protein [Armatimonadota bacterium]|nr:TRAM domain-containing protein [Armatimonadota bacterium]